MAYRLNSEHSSTRELHSVLAAARLPGDVAVVTAKLGFYQTGGAVGDRVTFHYAAKRIEVDCVNTLAYPAGEPVFDAGAAPTGIVNRTGGSGRRLVGFCLRDYPVGTARIEIEDFDGTRPVI